MALRLAAILDNSSFALASRFTSVICVNCTIGNDCTVWCVEVEDIEVIINSSLCNITIWG
eukprot:4654798-Prorocentrum_lima.AAC.1